jgi:membrane complex biogenesis BtpA family protein
MSNWLQGTLGTTKPIIAMLHLLPLPGDPEFDSTAGVKAVVSRAQEELRCLQDGGVDAVMVSNEFSLPYLTKTEPITAITMARVIGEMLTDFSVPFGVNVLWDGEASIDLAVATGARFVREVFTGVYASDFGLWDTNVGAAARHRARVNGSDVKMLYNIVPESAGYLASRDLRSIAASTIFATKPDAICVSGVTAGAPTDTEALEVVKEVAGEIPVFVNTGVTPDNVARQLAVADGGVVGTYFKKDGVFVNKVDPARVRELMAAVRTYRDSLS